METRVLLLPYSGRGNPYQRLLANSLRTQGIDVRFGEAAGRFPLRVALRQNGRAEVVHLHWLHPFVLAKDRPRMAARAAAFLGDLTLARRSGVRFVWTIHNVVNHLDQNRGLELAFNRMVARFCDLLVVHYPEAVDLVRRAYRLPDSKRVSVVPHGHYGDAYPNVISRGEARRRLHLRGDDTVFLFLGSIKSYKKIPELIAAFKTIRNDNARLLIAGKPGEETVRRELMRLCASDARIVARFEFIPDSEVQVYMNASDAVVIPSAELLTSGSAILAMSFGKALVAADTPHLRFLAAGGGGVLYRPRPGALERALDSAIAADLGAMGARNQAFVQEFSWERVGIETCSVYEDVLGSGRPVDGRIRTEKCDPEDCEQNGGEGRTSTAKVSGRLRGLNQ